MLKLAGLWRKEGKDGEPFYSGKLGYGVNVLLFKNRYKKVDKDPDLVLYLAEAEKKDRAKPEEKTEEVPF